MNNDTRKFLRKTLTRRGYTVFRNASMTFGLDIYANIPRLGDTVPQTIVDIGAKVGDMALAFNHMFLETAIFAVEPVATNFAKF